MTPKHELAVGNFVVSPTRNFQSQITAKFDEYVFVNGEEEPVKYENLSSLRIGPSVLKNAGFQEIGGFRWRSSHPELQGWVLEVNYEGVATFVHLSDNTKQSRTMEWLHELQNHYAKLTDEPLMIEW